ncbi:hypothetical protein BRC19_02535 [Candidatus Saccharibacteria bacterium QS_5_54_17]|nr:MAG: hypothetical protein BRC19_02535 [Candidatus Saccharibacteria bacterium QS_5_54_17]
MSDHQENSMGNNPETTPQWPDGFNENYLEKFQPAYIVERSPKELRDEDENDSDNQENFMDDNPETSPKWPLDEHSSKKFQHKVVVPWSATDTRPEYENRIYSDPHTPGETDEAGQQPPESIPNSRYQRVTTYLGSLMERVGLRGDPEERGQDQPGGQEYDPAGQERDQAEEELKRRIADIENRVHQGEELTAQDVYFLRKHDFRPKYDSETQNSGYEEGRDRPLRYRGPVQYEETEADIGRMLENSDHAQVARGLMSRGFEGEIILARNLDKFDDGAVDHFQLARNLTEHTLAENLDKFQYGAVNHAEVARRLMDRGREDVVARNLEKFHYGAVNHAELAQDMMDGSLVSKIFFADNLEKFHYGAVDYSKLAWDLMNDFEALLVQNLHKFREVPADVLDKMPLPHRCRRLLRIGLGSDE